jgi:hypothetical protein
MIYVYLFILNIKIEDKTTKEVRESLTLALKKVNNNNFNLNVNDNNNNSEEANSTKSIGGDDNNENDLNETDSNQLNVNNYFYLIKFYYFSPKFIYRKSDDNA